MTHSWVLILCLCGSFLLLSRSDQATTAGVEHKCDPNAPTEIKAALLTNYNMKNKPKTTDIESEELRLYFRLMNFTRDVFGDEFVEMKKWPIIDNPDCPANYDGTSRQAPVVAHKQIWENFYKTAVGCSDVMIIFQQDAVLGNPDAGIQALKYIKERGLKEDILYLGYCFESKGIPKFRINRRFQYFHPRVTGKTPKCMYAYAVSVAGAQKLHKLVQNCRHGLVDDQVHYYGEKHDITFSFVNNAAIDHAYLKPIFNMNGVHMKGDLYDGLFAQIEMDATLSPDPDGTIGYDSGKDRSLYILDNQKWRSIPDMDTYEKIVEKSKNKNNVKIYTTWQFNHYAVGAPVVTSDIEKLGKLYVFING